MKITRISLKIPLFRKTPDFLEKGPEMAENGRFWRKPRFIPPLCITFSVYADAAGTLPH